MISSCMCVSTPYQYIIKCLITKVQCFSWAIQNTQLAATCSAHYRLRLDRELGIFQLAIRSVGSTHAEGRHEKSRTEDISPTETSNADLKTWRGDGTLGPGLVIVQRIGKYEEVLAEWWENEDKLFIPHVRSNRQELPMDAGRRSLGRQLAARAPFLPAASHEPPRASAGPRPSSRLRPSSPHAHYISEEQKNDYSSGMYSPDSSISYSYQNN
jgi:hypothetical protein